MRGYPHKDSFPEALSHPPPHGCPWVHVIQAGQLCHVEFALVSWRGWIVGGAPIAVKRYFGQRTQDVWRFFRGRKATLSRIDPPHDSHAWLLEVRRPDHGVGIEGVPEADWRLAALIKGEEEIDES